MNNEPGTDFLIMVNSIDARSDGIGGKMFSGYESSGMSDQYLFYVNRFD